jgi:ABC-2 type transport system permease protein
MSARSQIWLVAWREVRERSRSRGFQASVVVMLLIVVGALVLPAALEPGAVTRDVGLAGTVSDDLPAALRAQGDGVDVTVRVHHFDDDDDGEKAVREGDVDVLVVDQRTLEWRSDADEQLEVIVAGAIQLVAVAERAGAAGISAEDLTGLLAPVPIENVELGSVAGRTPDDEAAALIMTILLFVAITTYGSLVLTGVVEEKSNRVVEVLLARMPARNLLAGKVAGIGLLGLAQFAVMAVVALVTTSVVDSVDVPAVRGAVLAWVVVWFVVGYAIYAVVYGALGALASRSEDAQSVAGPVTALLVAGYFASMSAVGRPDSGLAQVTSFVPVTAPLSMPSRVAMGAVGWWEPVVAVALSLVTIVGLVWLGGRLYAGAVLRTGPTLRLREAWSGTSDPRTERRRSALAALLRPRRSSRGPDPG